MLSQKNKEIWGAFKAFAIVADKNLPRMNFISVQLCGGGGDCRSPTISPPMTMMAPDNLEVSIRQENMILQTEESGFVHICQVSKHR